MNQLKSTFQIAQIARRTLNVAAFSALLGAGMAVAHAQQAPAPVVPAATAEPTLNFQLPVSDRSAALFSSSSDNQVAVAENHFDFLAAAENSDTQPPPRRSYGRPRYRGGNSNADGSNKYAFLVGAGYTQPLGNTYHYLRPSYGFQVGGGRNFNKNVALFLQFDYDRFGFNGRTIANQSTIFTGSPQDQGLDGSTHIWSVTLDPTFTLYSGEGLGAYVVGGVGFYHKAANFTFPQQGFQCDQFGNCFSFVQNSNFPGGSFYSNAPGYDGGFGLTYKVSRFSNERLYVEARYVFISNSQRQGVTINNLSTSTSNNAFPANSNRTTYIPVKAGIRF
ncbi:MAG: hypothetical protein M3R43_06270 [Acidobacteriota bacterium]|nr:hypothetical protein [Acidobacteriota bacterium]